MSKDKKSKINALHEQYVKQLENGAVGPKFFRQLMLQHPPQDITVYHAILAPNHRSAHDFAVEHDFNGERWGLLDDRALGMPDRTILHMTDDYWRTTGHQLEIRRERYHDGLQRFIGVEGMSIKQLAPPPSWHAHIDINQSEAKDDGDE